LEQREPIAVVDRFARLDLTAKDRNGNFSNASAAQRAIELFDLQLRAHPERAFELTQDMFIGRRSFLDVIREPAETIGALASLGDARAKRQVFTCYLDLRRVGDPQLLGLHGRTVRRRPDGTGSRARGSVRRLLHPLDATTGCRKGMTLATDADAVAEDDALAAPVTPGLQTSSTDDAEPRAPVAAGRAQEPPSTAAANAPKLKPAPGKKAGRRKATPKPKTGATTSRRKGGTRPFPASSFEDALLLADSIQKFGGGQPIRRLTLFHELGRSPDSSASRDMIYASSKYGLTKGTHQSEWLELTPEGDTATKPELSERERTRARFALAIERFTPFKALYDRYVGNKLPTAAVMRDHVADASELDVESASEAVETFIVNAKYVGVLKPLAGVERLLPLDHALDELPGRTALPPDEAGMEVTIRRGPSGQPAARDTDWAHTCFYITPIGDEDSEARRHADVFLASIVEPAIEALGRELTVVRADHIDRPGMITAQVIEHVFRSALVVADLSFHNPNVFYELALRHATSKPTVLISRAADPLPFDVAEFRTVQLDTNDIWSFVPQMETWRAEISRQARRALDDPDGGAGNPLTTFFPSYREHLG
jgi:hypothetical protein